MAKDTKKTEEKAALSAEQQEIFNEMMETIKAEAKQIAAEIVDEARAEAARIVAEAKQPVNVNPAEDPETKAWLNERVKIKLFKDNGKYKDDVFVSCNGESYAIKRGVEVEVPRKIALILEQSYSQDIETSEMMERKSAEFERSGL